MKQFSNSDSIEILPFHLNDVISFMPQGNPFRHKFVIKNQRQYRKLVRQNQWLLKSKMHRCKKIKPQPC